MNPPRLTSIRIQGYRPFDDFRADLGPLEVIVGANGSGKSSLFEFLQFLRDGMERPVPPGIVPGAALQVFHVPGPERIRWGLEVSGLGGSGLRYEAELAGPRGSVQFSFERVVTPEKTLLLDMNGPAGMILYGPELQSRQAFRPHVNQLLLGVVSGLESGVLYDLRRFIAGWTFYNSFQIDAARVRRPVPVEQEPLLREDAGNLSAVLFYLFSEHRPVFDEIEHHLRSAVPAFERLGVKGLGAPGEVIAFWREAGIDKDLSLADLSDGILRFLCWVVLCSYPKPPSLVCIDEPDLGLHPRTLPLLAGLFEKACDRTQFILATHASCFLQHFHLARLAVIRKSKGAAEFVKPRDSKVLLENLADFGPEELEAMHRSDELELLA